MFGQIPWRVGLALAFASPAVAQISGHAEFGLAARYSDEGPVDERVLSAETRLLLERQWYGDWGEMLDLRVLGIQELRGGTEFEIRQASLFIPLGRRFALTVGRQVLSWGPAQFEFVNDRFAKDFEAFFVGRDLEYLKAPNDAVRGRMFLGGLTVDAAWAPFFQADRLPDPRRFPVLDPTTGGPVFDPDFRSQLPPDDLAHGDVHLRIDRPMGRWETALYGYWGFTGQPEGVRVADGEPVVFHPRMAAAGLSLRGPVFAGVGWIEGALEDIREDGAGSDPALPSDRWQLLVGYQWSPAPTRTLMLQTVATGQIAGGALREAMRVVDPDHPRAESVHSRMQGSASQSFLEERLEAGARVLWGITERDVHWRLHLAYDYSDAVTVHLAYHGFAAGHPASRFGLLKDHDLVSVRFRYHL